MKNSTRQKICAIIFLIIGSLNAMDLQLQLRSCAYEEDQARSFYRVMGLQNDSQRILLQKLIEAWKVLKKSPDWAPWLETSEGQVNSSLELT